MVFLTDVRLHKVSIWHFLMRIDMEIQSFSTINWNCHISWPFETCRKQKTAPIRHRFSKLYEFIYSWPELTGLDGSSVASGKLIFSISSWRNSPSVVPSNKDMFDSKINPNKMADRVHVLLSKKSVVFLTPPSCWVPPPPKDEANPPPFGFCTMMTTTSKNAMKMIRIRKIENVLISKRL